MPQDEIPLQVRTAQVEIPVSQAELFGGELLAARRRDRDGRRRRGPHDLKRLDANFDVTSPELGVSRLRRSERNLAIDQHDTFDADRASSSDDIGRRPPRIERCLDDAGTIAQVDKDNAAQISRALYPAAKMNRGARIGRAQRSTHASPKRRR
jgi:hypothetical protein